LHGHLCLAAQRLVVRQTEQGVEQGADDGHVLVLQCVLALALSGESRLRLGIAQASLALLSACTAFDAGDPRVK
jgi:hypothetical protein